MFRRLLMVMFLVLAAVRTVQADADNVQENLDAAKSSYDRISKNLAEQLVALLHRHELAAERSGDLKELESARRDIQAFESKGTLPQSIPTSSYTSAIARARGKLVDAYNGAIKGFTREDRVDNAKALAAELAQLRKQWDAATPSPVHFLPSPKELTSQAFIIRNVGQHQVIGDDGHGLVLVPEGPTAQMRNCWRIFKLNNAYFIRSIATNKVFNIPWDVDRSGTQVIAWAGDGSAPNEAWELTEDANGVIITTKSHGLALDSARDPNNPNLWIVVQNPASAQAATQHWLLVPVAAEAAVNLISDGDFKADGASPWKLWSWRGNRKAASFVSSGSDRMLDIRVSDPDYVRVTQTVAVKPFTDYVLMGLVYTKNVVDVENLKNPLGVTLVSGNRGDANSHRSEALSGNTPWQRLELRFNSGGLRSIEIGVAFGEDSHICTGTAQFSKLQMIEAAPAAGATAAPQ